MLVTTITIPYDLTRHNALLTKKTLTNCITLPSKCSCIFHVYITWLVQSNPFFKLKKKEALNQFQSSSLFCM